MLQNQDIAKVIAIEGTFEKMWLSADYLQSNLNILGFNKIKSMFRWCKKPGFSIGDFEQQATIE